MTTISVTSNHEIIVECAFCPARWNRTKCSSRGRGRICNVCHLYVCPDCPNIVKCDVCRIIYCTECAVMMIHGGKQKCFRCQPEIPHPLYPLPRQNRPRPPPLPAIEPPRRSSPSKSATTSRRSSPTNVCEFCNRAICYSCPCENYICQRCNSSGRRCCRTCCIRHPHSRRR